jgi:hypothetical protein
MTFNDFLNAIIDDGSEAARFSYRQPRNRLKLDGSLRGFEECRGLDIEALSKLLQQARGATQIKYREQAEDYWYWRCRDAEIEWVCNVISAYLMKVGKPTIIPPTVRGLTKAAEIVGIAV